MTCSFCLGYFKMNVQTKFSICRCHGMWIRRVEFRAFFTVQTNQYFFFTHFAPIMPLSIDFPCHKQMPFSWQRKKYTLWIRCFAYIIVATVEQELFHVNIYGYPLKIGENPRVENEINQTSRHWLCPSFDCYYTLTHIQLIFS